MRFPRLFAFAIGAVFVGVPQHSLADWSEYIAASGSIGLGASVTIGKEMGVVHPMVNSWGPLLSVAKAIPEAVKRQQEYNLGLGTTVWEQTAITGSSMALKIGLKPLLSACFASGTCALSGAGATVAAGTLTVVVGIGVDAYLVGKVVKSALDYRHEQEALAASLQKVKDLQHKVDQQAALKQQLQVQKNTSQWQDQRSAQLAQQRTATALMTTPQVGTSLPASAALQLSKLTTIMTPAPTAVFDKSDDWLRAIMNNPKETPEARAIAAIGLGKDPSIFLTKSQSSKSQSPTPVPQAIQNFAKSTTLQQSGSPGTTVTSTSSSTKSDDWLRAIMNNPKETPQGRAIAAIALGKDPSNFLVTAQSSKSQVPLTSSRLSSAGTEGNRIAAAPYIYTNPQTGLTKVAPLTPAAAQRLPNYATPLRQVAPPFHSQSTFVPLHSPYTGFQARSPGGISLTKAAAMRMALDIDLEGASFSDGQIVLAGRSNKRQSIDAGLFLTALRAACEPGDPFFSLDADDGKVWLEEGDRAGRELWDHISGGFINSRGSGPNIQAFSARRDYPQLWSVISPKYPNLKTRLVFHPEWLRQTRLGEILYIADVLLKELSGGLPALPASRGLRAAAIDGYVSGDARRLKRFLQNPSVESQSVRLWFDFLPQIENATGGPLTTPPELRTLAADGNILDLSSIHPKMFVRIHNLTTRQDLPGHDPDLDAVSESVNARTEAYAAAYDELHALTDVFRAYVAAIKITQQERHICKSVSLTALPLLPSEKTSNSLPEYHPSELFLTVTTRPGGRYSVAQVNSINGGVSVRGKEFVKQELTVGKQTPVIQDIKRELASGAPSPMWRGNSGRQFIAFSLDAFDASDTIRETEHGVPATPTTTQEVILASHFGPPIDSKSGRAVLPYALMSRDAFNDETDLDGEITRISDWKIVLTSVGYSSGQIELIKTSGFYAAIYVDRRTGAITIAYRGGQTVSDSDAGSIDRIGNLDIQYKTAVDLAWIVKQEFPTAPVTLTGYGRGGELAVFAGEQTGIRQIVTFNGSTTPLFTHRGNPDWINVGWVSR